MVTLVHSGGFALSTQSEERRAEERRTVQIGIVAALSAALSDAPLTAALLWPNGAIHNIYAIVKVLVNISVLAGGNTGQEYDRVIGGRR